MRKFIHARGFRIYFITTTMNITAYKRLLYSACIFVVLAFPAQMISQPVTLKIPITMTNNGGVSRTVWFGVHPQATACIDDTLPLQFTVCDVDTEYGSPPTPPPEIPDLRFQTSDSCSADGGGQNAEFRSFRNNNQSDSLTMRFQAGAGGYPVTLSWPPNLTGLIDSIRILDINLGEKYTADMTKQSSLTVPSSRVTGVQFSMLLYHPKLSPPMMTAPTLSFPANNAADQDSSLTLAWNAVTGATYYRVQVSKDSLFSTLVVNDTSGSASKRIGGLSQVTKYYWRVSAHSYYLDGCYQGIPSSFTTRLYAPSIPNLLVPLQGGVVSPNPTMRWNKIALATSYRLQVSRLSDFSTTVTDTLMTDSVKQVGPLINCLAYNWRVIAGNSTGSTPSAIRTFTVQSAPPSPPQLGLPADNADSVLTTPTFSWSSTDACTQRYRLQVSSDSNFATTNLDTTITDSSFHMTIDLDTVAIYYWRVNAGGGAGSGAFSARRVFRTTSIVLPQIPLLVTPLNGDTTSLTPLFVWSRDAAAKTYHIQVSLDTSFTLLVIDDSTIVDPDTMKLADALQSCTEMYWRVRAKNLAGASEFSPRRSFQTMILPPVPPQLVAPGNDSADVPVLTGFTWNPSFCSVTYQLQVARDSGFRVISFDDMTLTDTGFVLTTALSGRSHYYWHVRAKNPLGVWGDWSVTSHFKTIPVGNPNWAIPIKVCESNAGAQCSEIYFGIHPDATYGIDPSLGEYELPGDPFPGMFDLRFTDITSRPDLFGSGVLVNLHPFANYKQIDSFRVSFTQGFGSYPMKISWSLRQVQDICDSMLLVDESGGTLVNVRMDRDSVAYVNNSSVTSLYIIEYAAYPVGVRPVAGKIPSGYVLYPNYPNPFNPTTRIDFSVEHSAVVRVAVYDVLGRQIALLANASFSPGIYSVQWDGRNEQHVPMPSGVYYVRLLTTSESGAEQHSASRKMLLLK